MVSYIDLDRAYQEHFIREAMEVDNLARFITSLQQEDLDYLRQNIQLLLRHLQKLKEKEQNIIDVRPAFFAQEGREKALSQQ